MSYDNLIEIINQDYILEIDNNETELSIDNIVVTDYIYCENKPKINSVELNGNKSPSALGLATVTQLNLKENSANKVTSIDENSTDVQYPSAKTVYTKYSLCADKSLSDLDSTGENHFANPSLSNLNTTGQAVVNSKINLDGSNLMTGSGSGKARCVVETSSADILPSWYRVYSDGWCEQGGYTSGSADSNGKTITLTKTYADTNYSFQATMNVTDMNNSTFGIREVRSRKTTSSVNVLTTYVNTGGQGFSEAYYFYWETKGYIS